MKITVDANYMFYHTSLGDHFSYEACESLLNWYDSFDPDEELDPVAIRCEWTEHDDMNALCKEHSHIGTLEEWHAENPDGRMSEYLVEVIDALKDWTEVIELDNGNILVNEY